MLVDGRYECRDELGRGGMSVVYRAHDTRLGREVALKLLRDDADLGRIVPERFRREAATIARLAHPNIVTVFDSGEEARRLYIVMEFVAGESLAHVLARGADLRRHVALLEKVARAVHYAHGLGVVHRDLKPANILVTRDGEPKVSDFGLAFVSGSDRLTRSGATLGTPAYMAPEQAAGRPDRICAQTDVYGLGAILYELLAGRPPASGDTALEMLQNVLVADPPRPRSVRSNVPADLETVALRALEKEPARRYSSAHAFADELRRWLEGEPILARPSSVGSRIVKYASRRRFIIVPAVLVAATVAVAAIWMSRARAESDALLLLERARPALEDAAQALRRRDVTHDDVAPRVKRAQAAIEEGVRGAPMSPLGHYLMGRAWELLGDLDRAEKCWRRAIALNDTFGPAHFQLGRVLLMQSIIESFGSSDEEREESRGEAKRLAEEARGAIERATRHGSGFDDALQQQVAAALLAHTANDVPRLRQIVEAGIERFRAADGVEDLHFLAAQQRPWEEAVAEYTRAIELRGGHWLALFCRGYAHSKLHRRADAIADYSRAIAINPSFALAWANRGHERDAARDFAGARDDFGRCLELAPRDPWYLTHRGRMRAALKDWDGALADYNRVIELAPSYSASYVARAQVHHEAGRLEEAMKDVERALARNPRDAAAIAIRGLCRSDSDAALADYDLALQINPDCLDALFNRGTERLRRGRFADAFADLDRAINLAPDMSELYGRRGLAHREHGDVERALSDLSKAIELDPRNAEALATRGDILRDRGDRAGALADYERALEAGGPGWYLRESVEQFAAELRKK